MRVLSSTVRKARTLTTFSALEVALILPVFFLLGFSRAAILLVPFRRYANKFGEQVPLETTQPMLTNAGQNRAKSIGRVVRSVAHITPWASLCLAQAIVATWLLRLMKLPYCAYFGVASAKQEDAANPLDAHAWVMAGDIAVTGGRGHKRFTVVQVFQYPREAQR